MGLRFLVEIRYKKMFLKTKISGIKIFISHKNF